LESFALGPGDLISRSIWLKSLSQIRNPDTNAYHFDPNDVGAFLRNQANGRAQGTNEGSVSSTHCVSPLLFRTARDTKLLPVVQLRSGVILLMGGSRVHLPSLFSVSSAFDQYARALVE
jgi:hypothetical protein